MAPCVARDRWHRAWPAAQTSLCAGFAARSIAPCVARSLFLIAQTSLCAVFAAISAKTRQNLAVGGLCGLSCFRPSFRIVLADVCGPECRKTSLCAVFAKIVFSPTPNATSNRSLIVLRLKPYFHCSGAKTRQLSIICMTSPPVTSCYSCFLKSSPVR